jgi:hypothetical protein
VDEHEDDDREHTVRGPRCEHVGLCA